MKAIQMNATLSNPSLYWPLNTVPPLAMLLTCVALGISCRQADTPNPAPAAPLDSNVVAVVAGVEISAGALQTELRRQYRVVPEGGLTAEQKLAALDGLVRQEAIYAQARAKGFDQSPQMQARIKQLVVAQFKEREFKSENPAVSEREIEAFYQANGGRYAQPTAIRGAAIFLSMPAAATAEKQAEFRARAEAVLAEARGAADETIFAQLVARHSEDQATRYRGGDLGWLTQGAAGVEATLTEALFALKTPGEFAPLAQTPRGFYIAKLLERRDASRKSLAEVREAIRYQLAREKAAQAEREFHDAMKAGLDITVNRERVEAISLPARKDEPPRMPGATTAQIR
jgi:peptidyl-prolyl cis-trans isomerase C